jgi:hypothetical protein
MESLISVLLDRCRQPLFHLHHESENIRSGDKALRLALIACLSSYQHGNCWKCSDLQLMCHILTVYLLCEIYCCML